MEKKNIVTILIIVLLGLVAIFLVLSRYNVISINNVYLESERVVLSINAKNQLDVIYEDALQYEIPTCLAGEITSKGIRIDNVEQAEIVRSNATSVTYIQCPVYIGTYKTIGTIHNHPNGNCRLSDQDISTYTSSMFRGQEIIGLKCDKGYVFYLLSFIESEVEEW